MPPRDPVTFNLNTQLQTAKHTRGRRRGKEGRGGLNERGEVKRWGWRESICEREEMREPVLVQR